MMRGSIVVDGKTCDACMESKTILLNCPICKGEFCNTCIRIHGCKRGDDYL